MKIKIEKIKLIIFTINAFISFKLIQRDLKNLTSSTLCAFNTTKVINHHHNIRAINPIAHINQKNCHIDVFLTFLTTFFSFNIDDLTKSFSQKLLGTTFDVIL